eukprot:7012530-Lingulodinium_polyedra.AAC.1
MELRSYSLQAGLASMGFLTQRALVPASQHPWSLALGDVDQNLDELANAEAPADKVAWKIQQLVQHKCSRHAIKAGLKLLLDCPWGTATVEQQHSSASVMVRLHGMYELDTLQ